MLDDVLPVLRLLDAVHARDGSGGCLNEGGALEHNLEGVGQRIFLAERVEQIFLIAETLRETLFRLLLRHVADLLDALERLDVRRDVLARALAEAIREIDADLHLRLERGSEPVHIEHEQ